MDAVPLEAALAFVDALCDSRESEAAGSKVARGLSCLLSTDLFKHAAESLSLASVSDDAFLSWPLSPAAVATRAAVKLLGFASRRFLDGPWVDAVQSLTRKECVAGVVRRMLCFPSDDDSLGDAFLLLEIMRKSS
jgi:hypothetical protein